MVPQKWTDTLTDKHGRINWLIESIGQEGDALKTFDIILLEEPTNIGEPAIIKQRKFVLPHGFLMWRRTWRAS